MNRYRVYIVPKTGRFAPLLTVLVNADNREDALQTAQLCCARTKAISAEDVRIRQGTAARSWAPEPRLHASSL